MKKIIISALLLTGATTALVTAPQSCSTLATSSIGLSIIKQILMGGLDKASNIYSNKQAFLQNDLVVSALPQNLRNVYNLLENVSPGLATKGKEYIAEAAVYTVNTSTPILRNAINSLNANDVSRIMQGEKGIATQILREKTQEQLIQTLMPKVDEKLNQFGIVKSINTALQGSSLLGNLLGGSNSTSNLGTNGLSKLASEQLVNGLFNIIENHEQQNKNTILGAFNGTSR